MDEIEVNPSEVNSCFRVSEPLKINIADFNKKRKLQAEPFELPTPKHKCWDRSFTTGPVAIFGETVEVDAIYTLINKDQKEALAQDYGSELESAKDSNSMADDSDSAMSAYGGGKVEPEYTMMLSYDRPSTSSASWGSNSNSFNYSSDNLRALSTATNEMEWGAVGAEHHPCHKVSEIQECQTLEEQLLEFGNIEHCTDEELEDILNSNGLNPNKFVLSSGRWTVGQEPQQGVRKPTIDQEFEQYFSMLML